MRLEPVASPTLLRTLGLPALSLVATVGVASFLAMLAGADPFATLGLIIKGAVGSKFAVLETLNRATPLIFTGLAVAGSTGTLAEEFVDSPMGGRMRAIPEPGPCGSEAAACSARKWRRAMIASNTGCTP